MTFRDFKWGKMEEWGLRPWLNPILFLLRVPGRVGFLFYGVASGGGMILVHRIQRRQVSVIIMEVDVVLGHRRRERESWIGDRNYVPLARWNDLEKKQKKSVLKVNTEQRNAFARLHNLFPFRRIKRLVSSSFKGKVTSYPLFAIVYKLYVNWPQKKKEKRNYHWIISSTCIILLLYCAIQKFKKRCVAV